VTRLLQRAHAREDEDAVAAVFGANHELVRALANKRAFSYQALVTSIPLALGAAGTARHDGDAPAVLVVAGVVELVLIASIFIARQVVRERVLTLIAEGAERAGLRVIAAARQRLPLTQGA